jgi:hypothetical protein
MSDDPVSVDPAKGRFFAIQAARLSGVAMVVLGLVIVNGKLGWPQPLGYVLLAAGLFDALFVPILLARRWKTPK